MLQIPSCKNSSIPVSLLLCR